MLNANNEAILATKRISFFEIWAFNLLHIIDFVLLGLNYVLRNYCYFDKLLARAVKSF